MKEDFLDLFPKLTVNSFNKYQYYENSDLIRLHIAGLHKLSNTKSKEQHLHSHSHAELHYAIEGYSIYQLGDGSIIKLEKNSWLLIPEDYPHKILEYSDPFIKFSCSFAIIPPSKAQNVHPAYELLCELLQSNHISQGIISDFSKNSINDIYSQMFSSHIFVDSLIKGITLNIILDTLSPLCFSKYTHKSGAIKDDTRLAIAMRFIQDNLSRKITCEDVAHKVYVGTRQLDRIFLKHTSVSVAEFIYEKKCEEAKRMLRFTTLPIKSISENLGFSAPTYFNRFFKKRVGIPPHQFRKQGQKDEKSLTPPTDE